MVTNKTFIKALTFTLSGLIGFTQTSELAINSNSKQAVYAASFLNAISQAKSKHEKHVSQNYEQSNWYGVEKNNKNNQLNARNLMVFLDVPNIPDYSDSVVSDLIDALGEQIAPIVVSKSLLGKVLGKKAYFGDPTEQILQVFFSNSEVSKIASSVQDHKEFFDTYRKYAYKNIFFNPEYICKLYHDHYEKIKNTDYSKNETIFLLTCLAAQHNFIEDDWNIQEIDQGHIVLIPKDLLVHYSMFQQSKPLSFYIKEKGDVEFLQEPVEESLDCLITVVDQIKSYQDSHYNETELPWIIYISGHGSDHLEKGLASIPLSNMAKDIYRCADTISVKLFALNYCYSGQMKGEVLRSELLKNDVHNTFKTPVMLSNMFNLSSSSSLVNFDDLRSHLFMNHLNKPMFAIQYHSYKSFFKAIGDAERIDQDINTFIYGLHNTKYGNLPIILLEEKDNPERLVWYPCRKNDFEIPSLSDTELYSAAQYDVDEKCPTKMFLIWENTIDKEIKLSSDMNTLPIGFVSLERRYTINKVEFSGLIEQFVSRFVQDTYERLLSINQLVTKDGILQEVYYVHNIAWIELNIPYHFVSSCIYRHNDTPHLLVYVRDMQDAEHFVHVDITSEQYDQLKQSVLS